MKELTRKQKIEFLEWYMSKWIYTVKMRTAHHICYALADYLGDCHYESDTLAKSWFPELLLFNEVASSYMKTIWMDFYSTYQQDNQLRYTIISFLHAMLTNP